MINIYDPVLKRIKRNTSLCRAASRVLELAEKRGVHTSKVATLANRVESLTEVVLNDCRRAATLGASEEEIECQMQPRSKA